MCFEKRIRVSCVSKMHHRVFIENLYRIRLMESGHLRWINMQQDKWDSTLLEMYFIGAPECLGSVETSKHVVVYISHPVARNGKPGKSFCHYILPHSYFE